MANKVLVIGQMDLLYPYGGALLAPFFATYAASAISRFQLRQGRRPGGVTAIIAFIVGALVALLCSFQLDVFMPWRWGTVGGKVDLGWLVWATGFLSVVISFVPVRLVTNFYQRRFDKTLLGGK